MIDYDTLNDYRNCKPVNWDSVELRLILNERKENYHIPDNIYSSASKKILDVNGRKIESLTDLLSQGLFEIVDEYLFEVPSASDRDIIYIRQGKFSEWQNLITYIPPLVLIAARLSKYHCLRWDKAFEYLSRYVVGNSKYTAIIPPYIPELDRVTSKEGLNDLHIHLSGSFEADALWEFALDNPEVICKGIFENTDKYSVKKLLAQEHIETGFDFWLYLRQARALRYFIVNRFLVPFNCSESYLSYPGCICEVSKYDNFAIKGLHPLYEALLNYRDIWGDKKYDYSALSMECLMYVMIISHLSSPDYKLKTQLAKAFHHYLLILGLVNRLSVHQFTQNGFEQFKMITDVDIRHELENFEYVDRFKQLNGNHKHRHNIGILEGRFSIKDTPLQNKSLIDSVYNGWKGTGFNNDGAKLVLIGHFIKKKDSCPNNLGGYLCRDYKLRRKVWQKANAILCYNEDYDIKHKIAGIDAAASEFDASPEVFAPAFRYLRRSGIKRATFHVGEDFNHLLSGIRAVYEAISFLDFHNSDRIGHGVAIGLDPTLWRKRLGDTIYMSRGEWFDDLIFAYHLLSERPELFNSSKCYNLITKIEVEVHKLIPEFHPSRLSNEGYSSNLADYVSAWLNRRWCPMLFFSKDFVDAQRYDFDIDEWKNGKNAKFSMSSDAARLLWMYHYDPDFKDTYNESIKIDFHSMDFLENDDLKSFQDVLCKIVKEKGIVMEVLPTSNVRVGYYDNMEDHHFMRWLNDGMTMVLGSDDAGIFMTNIYNEYGHVYDVIQRKKGNSAALNEIYSLNKNGFFYSFMEE